MSSVVTPPPRAAAPPVVAAPPAPVGPPVPLSRLHRFTVAQTQAMIRAGILEERPGVELLDGLLVVSHVKGNPHRVALNKTRKWLDGLLSGPLNSQIQDPIQLGERSAPEPDYCVFRGSDADFADRPPGPGDVLLVVEVADSSLADDRRDKLQLYARAGLPVYWIVNIPDRQVEVYAGPDPLADPPGYSTAAVYQPGQDVPLVLAGVAVAMVPAAELLP